MAAVTLTDVRKRYGKTEVVHGVSVDIADGEFIVIVGPSGCGKSTLLRMVAGLEEISEGTIEIAGRVVNDIEPTERNIAMVFQNYALYPHMSVFDNMAYGLKIAGLPRAEIAARIDKTARMLQLLDYLDRKPRALSGGQRQRVAMGRALVREPAAFLLDEPLSNLDAKLRVQMRLEIRDMQRKVDTTTLYVTHDQVEAMTLADRLIVMNEGHVEQIDTPLAIYQSPASPFVATFIGSPAMNLWPAAAGASPGSVSLGGQLELHGLELPAAAGDWLMGVRPEHLEPVAPDASADFIVLVRAMELLGADSLVHGRLEGQVGGAGEPLPEVIVRVPGNSLVSVGDRMGLRVDRRALHWFDRVGGRRLARAG